jgi:hypothetical protein
VKFDSNFRQRLSLWQTARGLDLQRFAVGRTARRHGTRGLITYSQLSACAAPRKSKALAIVIRESYAVLRAGRSAARALM